MFDETDSPELYDFRFGSGVVRLDDGVTLFLGRNEGDCVDDTGRAAGKGSVCVGGVWGIGGTIDIRFIRRASVGLMVRAPKPVACGGTTDIRFEEEEEGVVGVAAETFFTGVRTALVEEERVWSTLPVAVK